MKKPATLETQRLQAKNDPTRGDPGEPGAGRGRAELSPLPVRRGLPGDADFGMRGDLRGTHSEYRRRRRPHRGDMGDHRLHGAAVLLPVQNGEYRPERPGGALAPGPLDTVTISGEEGFYRKIRRDLRRPALAVFPKEFTGIGGEALPHHEHGRAVRPPRGGAGRPGLRPVPVGHVPPAPGGPAAY